MAPFKLDFPLIAHESADPAAVAALKSGSRLQLRLQQQEQQQPPAEASPATAAADALEGAPAAGSSEEAVQEAAAAVTAALSEAGEAACAAAPEVASAACTAAHAADASQPPSTSTQPSPGPVSSKPAPAVLLVVCSTSGQVVGMVPQDVAKRLPHAAAGAQVRVRSIKRETGGGVKALLRFEVLDPGSRAGGAARQASHWSADGAEADPTGYQLSRAQLEQLVAAEPVRLALADERLQQLLVEVDGAADPEKALEMLMSRDPAFETFAGQDVAGPAKAAAKPRASLVPPVPAGAAAASLNVPQRLTRSQTRGLSMSGVLQNRSEAAVSVAPQRPSAPPPLPDIDTMDRSNPLAASDYVLDIHSYYKRVEHKFRVAPDYMKNQPDINEKMRAILTDWLVEVHLKFKLMPETLFLTVNLIDRFLEKKQVTRKNLQLVGVTAMLIASKYEEIWAPEVRDFVYISDRAYTKDQILECEKLILNTLSFSLTLPTCYNFLARFQKAANIHLDRHASLLSGYVVELAMVDAGMLKYSYSLIAASAVYIASVATGHLQPYPVELARHSSHPLETVLPCASALVDCMQKAPTNSLCAVYKKYSSAKLSEVAKTAPPLQVVRDAEALAQVTGSC